jgi:hypothetical protein
MSEGLFESAKSILIELTKATVIGALFSSIFLILCWPFVFTSRFVVFVLTLGKHWLTHEEAMKNGFIQGLSLVLFMFATFYLHIVYGSQLYGADS